MTVTFVDTHFASGNEDTVSVIVPTYNRREYIGKALDSILAQTYKNFEIIVVDDGSTDGTKDFLERNYRRRITYLYQENKGASAARNLGILHSRGKFIAFLDSDDVWLPEKLEVQIEVLRSSDKKVALVFSSGWRIDNAGNLIDFAPKGKCPNEITSRDLALGPVIFAPPTNILIRKDCIIDIGFFNEEITFVEDWDLLIRLRQEYRFLFVDQPLFLYRFHGDAQSSLSAERVCTQLTHNIAHILRVKNTTTDQSIISRSLAKYYQTAACQLITLGLFEQVPTYLHEADCQGYSASQVGNHLLRRLTAVAVDAIIYMLMNNLPEEVVIKNIRKFFGLRSDNLDRNPELLVKKVVSGIYRSLALNVKLIKKTSRIKYFVLSVYEEPGSFRFWRLRLLVNRLFG
jgi:glycosyltransferase involved in cell wall biosynthesis